MSEEDDNYLKELEDELKTALDEEDAQTDLNDESSDDGVTDDAEVDDVSTETEQTKEEDKPDDEAKPDEEKPADKPADVDEPEGESSQEESNETDARVPIEAHTSVRRALRKQQRESREKDDEIAALKDKLDTAKLKAKTADIDITDDSGEFTEEKYLEMVEDGREGEANAMLAMSKQLKKLQANDAKEQETQSAKSLLDDDIAEAIDANPTIAKWDQLARNGVSKAWDTFVEIEKDLTGTFDSIDARFKEVQRLTEEKMKAAQKPVEDAPQDKSLNNVAGSAGKQTTADNLLGSGDTQSQYSAYEKMSQAEKDAVEAKLFS